MILVDNPQERDMKLLVNRIQNIIETIAANEDADKNKVSDENVIRYDESGMSMESQNYKLKKPAAAHVSSVIPESTTLQVEVVKEDEQEAENEPLQDQPVPNQEVPEPVNEVPEASQEVPEPVQTNQEPETRQEPEQPQVFQEQQPEESSEVHEHVIRYDKHGNTQEEYQDTEESEEEQQVESVPKKKKKKKTTKAPIDSDEDDGLSLNKILNDEYVKKQLAMREMHSDESNAMRDDDDVPLITIPMADILKQYNHHQGFISSTEEYSDETTKKDFLADPLIKNILEEISVERKVPQNYPSGVRVKPAAKRVFERHLGPSDESL